MPKLKKRHYIGKAYAAKQWSDRRTSSNIENSSDLDEQNSTISDNFDTEFISFREKITIDNIADLFELVKSKAGLKLTSVLMYMTLRYFHLNWSQCSGFLKQVNGYTAETAHKWANVFLSSDFNDFINEGRGGKHTSSFYDAFPDIELSAKSYSVQRCAAKAADFNVNELAKLIDDQFYLLTNTTKDPNNTLIRSIASCRLDLWRWGARFEPNSQRPYFEGHERQDVIQHRTKFVQHYIGLKDSFYTISEGENPQWKGPTSKTPIILLFHDESTFRSGEVSAKRWLYNGQAPFYSKGRGRSVMVSDFLVMHDSGPFFQLDHTEYVKALRKYPELDYEQDIDYIERSASASVCVGSDSYFDNATVLAQFERLFKLLEFKKCFKHHKIEVIVDNARTHSALVYNLYDFGKKIGTRCPVDYLQWTSESGDMQLLPCYFQEGDNKGLSKGLFQIAVELKCKPSPGIKLKDLHQLLSHHPAFKNISRLELLAKRYDVSIQFSPKFHCELNAIEGCWAHMKKFIRKKTDQNYNTFLRLMTEARNNFQHQKVHLKLFRRFWHTVEAYENGKTYEEVLQQYFDDRCTATVKSHRRITNSRL